jgi:hypothetical protein
MRRKSMTLVSSKRSRLLPRAKAFGMPVEDYARLEKPQLCPFRGLGAEASSTACNCPDSTVWVHHNTTNTILLERATELCSKSSERFSFHK